jgi:hypothetical protein
MYQWNSHTILLLPTPPLPYLLCLENIYTLLTDVDMEE